MCVTSELTIRGRQQATWCARQVTRRLAVAGAGRLVGAAELGSYLVWVVDVARRTYDWLVACVCVRERDCRMFCDISFASPLRPPPPPPPPPPLSLGFIRLLSIVISETLAVASLVTCYLSFSFPWVPIVPSKQTSEESGQCSSSRQSWKLPGRQTTFPLIFALCTGFQSMLESNTNVSSLCLGAALTSSGPVYLSDLLKIYTPSRQLASIFHRQPHTVHTVCQQ